MAALSLACAAPAVDERAPERAEAPVPQPVAAPTEADAVKPPLNRDPILVKSAAPDYPEGFVGSGINAEVVVRMLVDRMGRASHVRVESSPDSAFSQAALDALSQFEFLPAMRGGRLTNAEMEVTIHLREEIGDRALIDYEGGRIELLARTPASAVDTPARRLFAPRPAYPVEAVATGKSGEVIVEFVVDDDGRPAHVHIVESTHAEFSHAAVGAIALWRYSPALSGTRAVPTGVRYRISFEAGDFSEATRAMATRLLAGDAIDCVPQRLLSRHPRLRGRINPIATSFRTVRTTEAMPVRHAELIFIVDAKGLVRMPRVLKASDPIYGYEALAAVGYWIFEPALRKKEPVPVLVEMPYEF